MSYDDASDTAERITNLAHLSSAVGHHVINAYSAIVSNAEIIRLARRSDVPADPVALADMIIRTAVEASTVARRLIDYTRPVTQIGEGSVSLDKLITEIVLARRSDSRARYAWTVSAREVPRIVGNVDQIRAMINHLIRNAEEAMSGSGGTIAVSTEMDNRGWIALEITDTGPGMTPDLVERALEPFFSTKNGHLGLGLSISNGIWRRHRGNLSLKSRPGEGTCVRLCVDPKEGGLPGSR